VESEEACRALGGYPVDNPTCTGPGLCDPTNIVACCQDGFCQDKTVDECLVDGGYIARQCQPWEQPCDACAGVSCPQPEACRPSLEPYPLPGSVRLSRDLCESAVSTPRRGENRRLNDMVTAHKTRAVISGRMCEYVRSQIVIGTDGRAKIFMCTKRPEPPNVATTSAWSVGKPFIRRTEDPNGLIRRGRVAIKHAVPNPYWRQAELFSQARVCKPPVE